jgi:hypothetical protein
VLVVEKRRDDARGGSAEERVVNVGVGDRGLEIGDVGLDRGFADVEPRSA